MEGINFAGVAVVAVIFGLIGSLQPASGQRGKSYQLAALNLHNQYRAKHHAPLLRMDSHLNNIAVRCAQYYASRRRIDHSCPYKIKNKMGENLTAGSGGNWGQPQYAAETSTKMWYEEVRSYNRNKPGFSPSTGHFTQVVWKGSRKFGFGYANNNGYAVGVGLYGPAGNFIGKFRENVQ